MIHGVFGRGNSGREEVKRYILTGRLIFITCQINHKTERP